MADIQKYQDLTTPPGMAFVMFPGGQYKILYAEKDIVKLRDWAASLANHLTKQAIQYLEDQKKEKARLLAIRQEKIKAISSPSVAPEIDKQLEYLAGDEIPMMESKPLMEPLPNRTLNTDQGMIEVAGDVSDEDLAKMGYTIIPANGADTSANTDIKPESESESAEE